MNSLIRKKGNGDGFPSLRTKLSDLFDIDHFFNDLILSRPLVEGSKFGRLPATNIRETEKEFVVELAAPGLKKDDFLVDLNNGCLEIRVEKEEETEDKEEQFTRREYNYSVFFRSFELPETVNTEKIKAEYKDGVLKVRLPKLEEAKRNSTKKVTVT